MNIQPGCLAHRNSKHRHANGEIWDWQSAQQCMAISGCDAVM
ncbi:tRNA-dihydrouridine synthase, partial [Pseudomonas aeruginosa]